MLGTTLVLAASLVLGQVNGEDAFKSWTDFSVGGVWTCTEDGVKSEICYKRTLNDKFVQADLNSKGIPVTFLLGVDPETKKFTWWGFDGYGGTVKWVMSRESEHVWRSEGKGLGPDGEYALKDKLTRVDADTVREEIESFMVNGKPQKAVTTIWKRHR